MTHIFYIKKTVTKIYPYISERSTKKISFMRMIYYDLLSTFRIVFATNHVVMKEKKIRLYFYHPWAKINFSQDKVKYRFQCVNKYLILKCVINYKASLWFFWINIVNALSKICQQYFIYRLSLTNSADQESDVSNSAGSFLKFLSYIQMLFQYHFE